VSIATVNTLNTMGVRTLTGPANRAFRASRPRLQGYVTLGQSNDIVGPLGNAVDPDTVTALTNAGYDPMVIGGLIQQGATDQQLQSLPYGPGTTPDDMGAGAYALSASLGGAPPPVSTPMSPSIGGAAYAAGVTATGPFGALYEPAPPGTAAAAAAAATGPVGALVAPGPAGTPSAGSAIISATQGIAPVAAPAAPQSLLQWVEANAIWILLIAGAAIVLPPLIKKL
jgi:hypothetical protein